MADPVTAANKVISPKSLFVSCCKIVSYFVLNNNATTKMSKKDDMNEEPFLNPVESAVSTSVRRMHETAF